MTVPRESLPWWPDLSSRLDTEELMDDPRSDSVRLTRTLRQFPLLNLLLSRSRSLLRRYILEDIRRRQLKYVRVLDVGAGGGDIARYLVRTVENDTGASIQVDCCEADPRVAAFARRACAGYTTISVLEISVFHLAGEVAVEGRMTGGRLRAGRSAETPPYDYVISNHFLHHLTNDELSSFLDVSRRLCSGTMLCNDLERARLSYTVFRAVAPVALRGSFAAYDGATSVRRGFRRRELEDVIGRSAWADRARVGSVEPGRLFLVARAQ